MNDLKAMFAAALAAQHAGRLAEAGERYRHLLAREPGAISALCNLSGVLLELGDAAEAEQQARRAVAIAGDLPAVHANLISILQVLGRHNDATRAATTALARGIRSAELWCAQGVGLERVGAWTAARAAYAEALALEPQHGPALSGALYLARSVCDWGQSAGYLERFRAGIARGDAGLTPFVYLACDDDPVAQRRVAELWSSSGPVAARPTWQAAVDGRITVGYASADFKDHPTSPAAVLEQHDRTRFRVLCYSWGPDDGGPVRARIRAACDAFVDVRGMTAAQIAARMRRDGVQVLVDLKGHTSDAQPELWPLRPAPVQVNWLGYPGTLGGRAWDWIVADESVVPVGAEGGYCEQVWRLPLCYQPNDAKRPHPQHGRARAECGLPEDAVVFCCFNAAWKIDAARFAEWMQVLREVPGSVLWLLDSRPGEGLVENLREAARAAGVAAERLVFMPRRPHAEYLAAYLRADLFLDTDPYSAHTTASDALWMGCPVLTHAGPSFASRVASSLLGAVGLPELAVGSREAMVARAIELGRAPARLAALRAGLVAARATAPLFDIVRFTRALEQAYLGFAAQAAART